jgi:hypothetical protein
MTTIIIIIICNIFTIARNKKCFNSIQILMYKHLIILFESRAVVLTFKHNAPLSFNTKPQAPHEIWDHNFILKLKKDLV